MTMTVFDIVVLIAAARGLAMVIGGIWLLARGAITLAATPKTDALTIEWKKQFRINTQVPGLAFFLVGMMFIGLSLRFSQPPDVMPIEFHGQFKGVEGPVTVLVAPNRWQIPTTTTGMLQGKVYPDLSMLILVATAPGYEPFSTVIALRQQGQRLAELGTLELKKRVGEIKANSSNIGAIDFNPPDQGVGGSSFGVPQ